MAARGVRDIVSVMAAAVAAIVAKTKRWHGVKWRHRRDAVGATAA